MKKIIAVLSVSALLLSFTACGGTKETEENSTTAPTETVSQDAETTTQSEDTTSDETGITIEDVTDEAGEKADTTAASQDVTDAAEESTTKPGDTKKADDTTKPGETKKPGDKTTAKDKKSDVKTTVKVTTTKKVSGLNTNNISEIVPFYVAAAKKTNKNNPVVSRKKSLTSLNGGDGAVGDIISKLEGAGKSALERKSGEDKGLRGYPEKIQNSDIASATAKSDGKYTTITMKVKDFTANASTREDEGSVGHVIGVLNTLDAAIKELSIVNVEDTSGIKLKYTDAKVTAKIDNEKGIIVAATWDFKVTVTINNTKGKVLLIPVTLNNASAVITYHADYPSTL